MPLKRKRLEFDFNDNDNGYNNKNNLHQHLISASINHSTTSTISTSDFINDDFENKRRKLDDSEIISTKNTTNGNQQINIQSLSDDLIELIFSFLNEQELINCAQTCKYWYFLYSKDSFRSLLNICKRKYNCSCNTDSVNIQQPTAQKLVQYYCSNTIEHLQLVHQCAKEFGNNFDKVGSDKLPAIFSVLHKQDELSLKKAACLLDHGVDVNIRNKDGRTILHYFAALCTKAFPLKWLVDVKGFNCQHALSYAGQSPLHDAALNGQLAGALFLITRLRFNVNAADSNGQTPLHFAAIAGNKRMIKLLLKFKANIQARDKKGATALLLAAWHGRIECVKWLLEHDPNLDMLQQVSYDGYSALHFAVLSNKIEVISYLLEKGININVRDKKGATPLMWAARHNSIAIVDYLLSHKANPNIRDNEGESVVFDAVYQSNLNMLKLIVKKGRNVDVSHTNKANQNIIFIAFREQNYQIVNYLLQDIYRQLMQTFTVDSFDQNNSHSTPQTTNSAVTATATQAIAVPDNCNATSSSSSYKRTK